MIYTLTDSTGENRSQIVINIPQNILKDIFKKLIKHYEPSTKVSAGEAFETFIKKLLPKTEVSRKMKNFPIDCSLYFIQAYQTTLDSINEDLLKELENTGIMFISKLFDILDNKLFLSCHFTRTLWRAEEYLLRSAEEYAAAIALTTVVELFAGFNHYRFSLKPVTKIEDKNQKTDYT